MEGFGFPDPSGSGMLLPRPFFSDDEKTFQYDETLPSLPVPPLEHTLERYLDSVKPHLTEEEYKNTERIVQEFGSGAGRELQIKLVQKSKTMRNWLEKWWEDIAYLCNREPHSPFVNFAGASPSNFKIIPPQEGTQLPRAAMSVWYGLKYWELLYKEKLIVDRGGMTEKKVWSMSQFRRMFNSCKTPDFMLDKFNFHFKTETEGKCHRHLLVLCKGRIFSMDVMDKDMNIFTAPELEHQLRAIQDRCAALEEGPKVGALTGHRRPEWAQARQQLIDLDPQNKAHLHTIETALFGVALDDNSPQNMSELSHESLCGDSTNRWLDKSYVMIIYKNGTIGSNCDHAPHDAMLMISSTLWSHIGLMLNGPDWQGTTDIRPNLPKPIELEFKVDVEIQKVIKEAHDLNTAAGQSIDVYNEQYKTYGRKKIRAVKVHPDAHIQMALQYAYYKLYGKPAATYETASTRQFYNARTETLRSCTPEAIKFAQTMLNLKATKKEKLDALHTAFDKHNRLMSEGQAALGCDRHLMGLQILAAEADMEPPEIFKDPAYTKSGGNGNFVLSTSFVGYTPVFGGVAPMCKNGYGTFYSIDSEEINFFIASWKNDVTTNTKMFFHAISSCLDEVMELLTDPSTEKPSPASKI